MAGLKAPSAMNQQPWRIFIIRDKAFLRNTGKLMFERMKVIIELFLFCASCILCVFVVLR